MVELLMSTMKNIELKRPGAGIGAVKRRAIPLAGPTLVETYLLQSGTALPLVIRPALVDIDLPSWGERNREFLEASLVKHGAVLFRDFAVESVDEFERFIKSISGGMMEYREHTSPRTGGRKTIYTPTEYPAEEMNGLNNKKRDEPVGPSTV